MPEVLLRVFLWGQVEVQELSAPALLALCHLETGMGPLCLVGNGPTQPSPSLWGAEIEHWPLRVLALQLLSLDLHSQPVFGSEGLM